MVFTDYIIAFAVYNKTDFVNLCAKFDLQQTKHVLRLIPLQKKDGHPSGDRLFLEQGTGVEPALTAWEAAVIPIYQPCKIGTSQSIAHPFAKSKGILSLIIYSLFRTASTQRAAIPRRRQRRQCPAKTPPRSASRSGRCISPPSK